MNSNQTLERNEMMNDTYIRLGSGMIACALVLGVVGIASAVPILTLPSTIIAEATSAAGAVVTFAATAEAESGKTLSSFSVTPASGSTFALGTTTVNATAVDNVGGSTSGTFTVRVMDTTAPAVTTSGNLSFETTNPSGLIVNYAAATAFDAVDGATTIQYSIASGSNFPVGLTTVQASSMDAAGNRGSSSFSVNVTLVPEPGMLALLPATLLTLRRRRANA
jgi:hypothetical protein